MLASPSTRATSEHHSSDLLRLINDPTSITMGLAGGTVSLFENCPI